MAVVGWKADRLRAVARVQGLKEIMRANKYIRKKRLQKARRFGRFTDEQWLELVAEFDGKCVSCLDKPERLERDHIVPIYQGGLDNIENIQPLCKRCNCQKGPENFNWKEYRRELRNNAKD